MKKISNLKFEICGGARLLNLLLLLALVLNGGNVFAQTNQNVPKAGDYAAFSRFVTDRNIFDPNRVPRYTSGGRTRQVQRPRARAASTPTVTLVGTMAYEKGDFAFFSSNEADQKKVLPVSEKIAGYTVKAISRTGVMLAGTDKKEFEMKVGEVLRQENGGWHLDGAGDAAATTTGSSETSSSSESKPSPALEGNDVLKRLMEKRAKEEK
jgi:hypothetical protein